MGENFYISYHCFFSSIPSSKSKLFFKNPMPNSIHCIYNIVCDCVYVTTICCLNKYYKLYSMLLFPNSRLCWNTGKLSYVLMWNILLNKKLIRQTFGLLQWSLDLTLLDFGLSPVIFSRLNPRPHNLHYFKPKVWKTLESLQGFSVKFSQTFPRGCGHWEILMTLGNSQKQIFTDKPYGLSTVCTKWWLG